MIPHKTKNGEILNAMTIDVEDWYHSITSIPFKDWHQYEDRVEVCTRKILEIFRNFQITATFFCLGYIAENNPKLIEAIQKDGHEIGTHGYAHQLVYNMTPDEFRKDLIASINILEQITGEKVVGYRAPYWTITKDSYWALDILAEEGLKYDASIYPIKTHIFGIPESPMHPYEISSEQNQKLKLLEIPPTVVEYLGKRIPVAGGIFLRALPYAFVKSALRKVNSNQTTAVVYFHPPEIDPKKPKLKLPLRERLLHYYNLDTIESKIKKLLEDFSFSSIRNSFSIK
jgi:polysaccharide deacetylase family protein (PEP-CTERM system associated)